MFQMFVGFDPFHNKDETIKSTLYKEALFHFGEDVESPVTAMLSKNPSDRPDIEDSYEDEWLNEPTF